MAWQNLRSEIVEEFESFPSGLDRDKDRVEGIIWNWHEGQIGSVTADRAARNQYDRWYGKQVYYPRHRINLLAKMKLRYHTKMATDPEYRARRKASWTKRNQLVKKGHPAWERKMQRQKERRLERMKDPVYAAKIREQKKLAHRRRRAAKKNGKASPGST